MTDVIVVGGGATGLAAALALVERGKRVLLLDAGPQIDPREKRQSSTGSSARWAVDQTRHLYVDDAEHPYETPDDAPFCWVRGRQVGGRLQTWGRVCLRMTDFDAWPIAYADLAPHYTRMERLLRVCGSDDGGDVAPAGELGAPLPKGPGEDVFREAMKRIAPEQRVLAGRLAMTTPVAIVREVSKSGLFTIRPNAIVLRLEATATRATGVVVRAEGGEEVLQADSVVLAASSIESVSILLASTSKEHPNGLGGSSGLLGRHLLDHLTILVCGVHEKAPFDDSLDAALAGGAYCHVPSIAPDEPRALKRPFGVQITFARGLPRTYPPMFGRMVDEAQRRRAVAFWMQAFGEVIPREDNQVTLTDKRDRWGARIPHIRFRYSEEEKQLAAHMTKRMRAMAAAAGFDALYDDLADLRPGTSVHELGGARMGTSPKDSVVRPDNRLWDVENVHVVDGACWPSAAWQNPTLTMMAVAYRAGTIL